MSRVSVLMAVYNGAPFLEETMNSILGQSYADFDFVIIDDGSSDTSVEIIRSYQDKRIYLIENELNKGVAYSLNLGLSFIGSEYIVRCDADDISRVDRIARQVSFMDNNKEIGLSGTWYREFGTGDKQYLNPDDPDEIRTKLLYANPIGHPTVILRSAQFERFRLRYDENFNSARITHCGPNVPADFSYQILTRYLFNIAATTSKFPPNFQRPRNLKA